MKRKFLAILALLVVLAMGLTSCDAIESILGQLPWGTETPDDNDGENPDTDDGKTDDGKTDDGKTDDGKTDEDVDPDDDTTKDDDTKDDDTKDDDTKDDDNKGEPELKPTNVYIVGDSTACSFSDSYYFPRYGWGTQLQNYLHEEATVHNLALSGRSSKSFLKEENYTKLTENIARGDYLIIAFGHNDEKSADEARFTDASKGIEDETSFAYYLYNYYIKLAEDAGATPILVTPIVRANTNDDYTGASGHITENGDYRQAILDLAEAKDIAVVDLTAITEARYKEIGYDEAIKYHAVTGGKYDDSGEVIENWSTIDKTHLNIYGAKYVAFRLAEELRKIDDIRIYVLDNAAPTEADRVPNASYTVPEYEAPDLENYSPASQFTTITEGWYGTAFGKTGGNPQSSSNQYSAKETEEGVFTVGSYRNDKGKFATNEDGFAFVFTQVEASKNFKITVTATVLQTANKNQAGFGLMLRDDVIINQTADGNDINNFVTAGILSTSESPMKANFYRENGKLNQGTELNGMYKADDVFTFTIERIGQTVNVKTEYNGQTYTESYYDFDFFAVDNEYMYVGMFANRGTVIEFTNLEFTITGESQGA